MRRWIAGLQWMAVGLLLAGCGGQSAEPTPQVDAPAPSEVESPAEAASQQVEPLEEPAAESVASEHPDDSPSGDQPATEAAAEAAAAQPAGPRPSLLVRFMIQPASGVMESTGQNLISSLGSMTSGGRAKPAAAEPGPSPDSPQAPEADQPTLSVEEAAESGVTPR